MFYKNNIIVLEGIHFSFYIILAPSYRMEMRGDGQNLTCGKDILRKTVQVSENLT